MKNLTLNKSTWTSILFVIFSIFILSTVFYLWTSRRAKEAPGAGFPEKLAFYYGFPSRVNDSGGDVKKATQVFKEYDILVFGNTLDSPSNQDHAPSKTIMSNLKEYGARVYGYIDLCYDGGNYCSGLPLSEIYSSTDRWAAMGAEGIFFDQVGFEYSVSRDRLNAAIDYVHSQGLSAFINAWDPDDVFSETVHDKFNPSGAPPHLGPNDYFLHESFAVTLNEYQDPAFLIEKSEKALKWKKLYGTKMATVNTTAFSNPPFEQEKADYVWWMTLLYGFDAMAWGETGIYSADCQCLPFRPRPNPANIGSPIEPLTVSHNGSLHRRATTAGTIEVDTTIYTGRFIPGAPPEPPRVQNYIIQPVSATTDLVSGNAIFLLGTSRLNLTIQSNGAPINAYRIFLDSDVNHATGFTHSGNVAVGADFMVENGQLYEFDGSNQTDWNWITTGPVTVTGVGANRIQVSLPFSQINYVDGTNLPVLVENLNSANMETVGLLPHSPDEWIVQSAPRRADNLNSQQVSKSGDLAYGNVIFLEDKVTFTIRSSETPIDSYRIYVDQDIDPTTGFLHQGNSLVGADYLIEDEKLFRFKGADQTDWSWSEVGPVGLTGVGSDEIQATIPISQINYSPGKNLAILAENLNHPGKAGLDVLPRSPGVWVVEYSSKDVVVYSSNEVAQDGEQGPDLVLGSVAFQEDMLTFTIQSHQDPIDSYRIFLDMDGNKDTGFTHFRNDSSGSEFLIENGMLYQFSGTSPIQWSWPEVDAVIESGVGTTQVEVNVTYNQINYVSGEKLGILMENLDPNWVTYDLVPRSPGLWRVP